MSGSHDVTDLHKSLGLLINIGEKLVVKCEEHKDISGVGKLLKNCKAELNYLKKVILLNKSVCKDLWLWSMLRWLCFTDSLTIKGIFIYFVKLSQKEKFSEAVLKSSNLSNLQGTLLITYF